LDRLLLDTFKLSAASEFLRQYAEDIDYHVAIPGYAGELLIKVSESSLLRTLPADDDLRSYFDRESTSVTYDSIDRCAGTTSSFAAVAIGFRY